MHFLDILIKILSIIIPLILSVAYLTYWERKMLASMHVRLGPNKLGFIGMLQPIADVIKLLSKELIIPSQSNKVLYLVAPLISLISAFSAWAIIPFGPNSILADLNAGLLYFMSMTSLSIYGIIIGGWASNSKYATLAALRAAAQMISYELCIAFILLTILLVSNSLNITDIILAQTNGWFYDHGLNFLSWNWLPLFPLFIVYIIASVAECNRHPFDVVEGESEIVAGHMVEYSGIAFSLFFLSEYANMLLLSAMAAIMFLGGWLPVIDIAPLNLLPPQFWFLLKTFLIVSVFIWMRATFPRYRYDQIMRLGWKVLIPLTGIWFLLIAFWIRSPFSIWSTI